MSADGRFVAFESQAGDLILGTARSTASTSSSATQCGGRPSSQRGHARRDPNASSFDPSISADGRYVAFQSHATDLVPVDRNRWPDVFVRDMETGTIVRASVDARGGEADWSSSNPSLSADGRLVAFDSLSSNLVEGDVNHESDVFIRDVIAGTTVRVSLDADGGNANDGSLLPSISADGRLWRSVIRLRLGR